MTKYWILLMAISLSLSPVLFADDPPAEPPEEPQVNEVAQNLVDAIDAFIENHEDEMGTFDAAQYLDGINTIANAIPANADLSHFDVDAYMSGLNTRVNSALTQLSGHPDLQGEYLRETANFFMQEYFKDMERGIEDIDTSAYLSDLDRLNENYASRLLPPPEGEGSAEDGYNPMDYLDKAAGTKAKAKFELLWGGVGNGWLGYNLVSLMQAFQSRFSHDAVAQTDMQFLLDLWPQSAEAYLMNTAYDNGMYYITNPNDPDAREQSYYLSEFGNPTSDVNQEEFDVGSNSTRLVTASYNNRSYGYQYTNGTHDIISLTTGGRRYTLSENIYTSPLVLDMDGDKAIEASGGEWLPHLYENGNRLVEFDMNGDNFVDLCEWVGPNDGLLIVYKNQAEVSGNDLFGNAGGYDHGYEKLSLLDKNGDSQLTGEELATLSVWQDANSDAKADKGEVKTVKELGITMISLSYDRDVVSHFMQNGQQKMMVDWFPSLFIIKRTR